MYQSPSLFLWRIDVTKYIKLTVYIGAGEHHCTSMKSYTADQVGLWSHSDVYQWGFWQTVVVQSLTWTKAKVLALVTQHVTGWGGGKVKNERNLIMSKCRQKLFCDFLFLLYVFFKVFVWCSGGYVSLQQENCLVQCQ